MKDKIYDIIEVADENETLSKIYDIIMMIAILASTIPLTTKQHYPFYDWIDRVTAVIFIIDYIMRLWTADLKLKKGKISYIEYPFTPMALVDLISLIPLLGMMNSNLNIFSTFRLLRIVRLLKAVRYSKNLRIIAKVFDRQKKSLQVVCVLAISYILIAALVIFNVEPQTFNTFFDAVYWATVSLAAVGYGDIYPVTFAGKLITMISVIFGIAVVALPASILTAGYMKEVVKQSDEESK